MYKVLAPFRFLYKVYFGLMYLLIGIPMFPFMYVFVRGEKKFKRARVIKKVWTAILMVFTGLRIQVKGKENFPANGNYIVCANHSSYLDIILMFYVIPHDFAFLGKAEVLKWPIINIFFKRGVDIPVYRGSVKRAKECIDLAEVALKDGRSVAIFPEGGIVHGSRLRRFKNGAFKLAESTEVPIVPIVFHNNYKLFSTAEDLWGHARPGKSRIEILPPIDVSEVDDFISLRNETHSRIDQVLEQR